MNHQKNKTSCLLGYVYQSQGVILGLDRGARAFVYNTETNARFS